MRKCTRVRLRALYRHHVAHENEETPEARVAEGLSEDFAV